MKDYLGCPVCDMAFTPTPAQKRLHQQDQPVYCSTACASQVQEGSTTMICSVCGHSAIWYAPSQAFYEYLDFDFRRFCSLECLFEALLADQLISMPPSSAKQLIPLEIMSDVQGRTSKGIKSNPQIYLFTILSSMYPDLDWQMEYSINTYSYQKDRPKRYRLDIAETNLYIAIECDGPSHRSRQARSDDIVRDMMLGELGWVTVRVTYEEIRNDIEGCLHKVQQAIKWQAPMLTSEVNGDLIYERVRKKKRR